MWERGGVCEWVECEREKKQRKKDKPKKRERTETDKKTNKMIKKINNKKKHEEKKTKKKKKLWLLWAHSSSGEQPTASSRFGCTGVLWVLTGTHRCDTPIKAGIWGHQSVLLWNVEWTESCLW